METTKDHPEQSVEAATAQPSLGPEPGGESAADSDLDAQVLGMLGSASISMYEIAERSKATPQEAQAAVWRLHERKLARKTGSGNWVVDRVNQDDDEEPAPGRLPSRKR